MFFELFQLFGIESAFEEKLAILPRAAFLVEVMEQELVFSLDLSELGLKELFLVLSFEEEKELKAQLLVLVLVLIAQEFSVKVEVKKELLMQVRVWVEVELKVKKVRLQVGAEVHFFSVVQDLLV